MVLVKCKTLPALYFTKTHSFVIPEQSMSCNQNSVTVFSLVSQNVILSSSFYYENIHFQEDETLAKHKVKLCCFKVV